MSSHFLTTRVPRLLGWLWYPGLTPMLVSITFPFAFHISVFFHSFFFTCHWISLVFPLYDRPICTHSIDPSLTHFLGEFQAWDWLWYPMVWSQRRSRSAHDAEISLQISAMAEV